MPSLDQRDEGRKLLFNPTDGDGAMEERLPNKGTARGTMLAKQGGDGRKIFRHIILLLSPANFLPLARTDQKPEHKGAQVWGLWGPPPWDTDLRKK